jgi:hypothetical protein
MTKAFQPALIPPINSEVGHWFADVLHGQAAPAA